MQMPSHNFIVAGVIQLSSTLAAGGGKGIPPSPGKIIINM